MDAGLVAALCFAVVGALAGHALARRGWRKAALALLVLLGVVALGLWLASRRAEGMRSLAFLAVMTAAALPALGGAAIGGSIGWWQRQRHGA